MQLLSNNAFGKGYAELPLGYTIGTFDQFYHPMDQNWRLGAFFTSDGEIHKGRVPYRRPITFFTKLGLLYPVIKKYSRKKVKPFFVHQYEKIITFWFL